MKRVTGIGGVFFRSKDPDKIKNWYSTHLGLNCDQYGTTFQWRQLDGTIGHTAWSPMDEKTAYLDPSKREFMINYRVENLEELLKVLKSEGVQTVGEMEVYDYGKFGWIMDPEGNKIELWEPVESTFEKMVEGKTT